MNAIQRWLKALFPAAEAAERQTVTEMEERGGTMLDLSMFTEDVQAATRAAIEGNIRWRTELENARRIKLYTLEVEAYNLMVQQYRGNATVLAGLVPPEVPTAVEWRWNQDASITEYELNTPLVDPPLPLLEKTVPAPQPDGQVVFGDNLASVGYPGWYASSKLVDGVSQSTTVDVGTVAVGPDGRRYKLTAMGFSGLAKYWVVET